MWINGKALHEIATAQLKIELAKQNEQIWINAIIEELQYRDSNPEYHF